jgi:hypothetical protein
METDERAEKDLEENCRGLIKVLSLSGEKHEKPQLGKSIFRQILEPSTSKI